MLNELFTWDDGRPSVLVIVNIMTVIVNILSSLTWDDGWDLTVRHISGERSVVHAQRIYEITRIRLHLPGREHGIAQIPPEMGLKSKK